MPTDPMIGRTLARTIKIQRKIGAGGMGNVYEGVQEHLGRQVAIKVMSPAHARNPVAAEYFLREARAASQLRHPNIIQIFDFGTEDDNTIFIAMELVPGKPLGQLLKREFPLPSARIITILEQALAGLAEAHRKQFVHRDLKPDNLMIEQVDGRDFVKILDFGIAQSQAEDRATGPLTQANAVVGTPQYMSPEQARSANVDARSDLYSLGVILYELLTRTVPFDEPSIPETLYAVLTREPEPPSVAQRDVAIDPGLEAICLRAIKKDPALRYQSAEEFREALRALATDGRVPTSHVAKAPPRESVVSSTAVPSVSADAAFATPEFSAGFGTGLLAERATVAVVVLQQRSHQRFDPEQMSQLRETFDDAIATTAAQWRGEVLTRQGAFTTIAFGIRAPAPDDEVRAANAAIVLRTHLNEIAPEGTAFAFALAAGEVFCPSGDVTRAAGAALDDATDLARAAADGQIALFADNLGERLGAKFRLSALDEDGSCRLVGPLAAPNILREHPTTHIELIGRDAEIATLLTGFSRLAEGHGTILGVYGEAGVGKSAILAEVVKTAQQRKIPALQARWSSDSAEAVRVAQVQWLADLVRHLGYPIADRLTAFRSLVEPDHARLLASFMAEKLEEVFGLTDATPRTAEQQLRVAQTMRVAVTQLFEALSRSSPIVVVLDGVERASPALQQLVDDWAARCAKLPIMFVVGAREGAGAKLKGPAGTLDLKPLGARASHAFLKVRLPATVPDDVVTQLARIGAGYPMHLEHLARMARSPKFDIATADAALAATSDIAELLRQRVYAQPTSYQNVLAVLAALGDGVERAHLLQLCPPAWDAPKIVANLIEDRLLELVGDENPRLYFRPSALGHVIYDRLSRKMLRQIHQRARDFYEARLRATESPSREDQLALVRHLERDDAPEAAYDVLHTLVQRVFREHDYDAAAQLLTRAIALLEKIPDRDEEVARQQLQLARAERAIGESSHAIDRCRRLARRTDLPAAFISEVQIELAQMWLEGEDVDLIANLARTILRDVRQLQAGRPDDRNLRYLLIMALRLSTEVHLNQRKLPQALELIFEAAGIIERGEVNPNSNPRGPELVWGTLTLASRVHLAAGDTTAARAALDYARHVVTACGDLRGQVAVAANISAVHAQQTELEHAYKELSDALRIARQLGAPMILAKLEYNRGVLLRRQQRLDMAQQAFEASARLADALDWREGIAQSEAQLAQLRSHARRRV